MKNNTNLVLVGMMGSGKSVIAKILSLQPGYKLVDTDHQIEKRQGAHVGQIIREKGEVFFRNLETQLLRDLVNRKNEKMIVATGGGSILALENRNLLKELGNVVWLKAELDTLLKRVLDSDVDRPLLGSGSEQEIMRSLLRIYQDRLPLYQSLADFTIEVDHHEPAQIAQQISDQFFAARFWR
ncbi:MAG: shikimate kinase [Candidatus Caenarcaniphilales bacterium]|nr:shikimate kinase [Candidatus Caenarcaniphilales bacterium]